MAKLNRKQFYFFVALWGASITELALAGVTGFALSSPLVVLGLCGAAVGVVGSLAVVFRGRKN